MTAIHRWRDLLALLGRGGRWWSVPFAIVLLIYGFMPGVIILMTGAFVDAIPAAIDRGLGSAAGTAALLVLAGLVTALLASTLSGNALWEICRLLNSRFSLEVYRTVAHVTLETPGIAALEDPALADELQAIQEADRRGVLRRTATMMASVASCRCAGIAALLVLCGFSWWAPLPLLVAWSLANRVFVKAMERGLDVDISDGAVHQRRAEYMRALVLQPAAAKEIRIFGLGDWMVTQYGTTWLHALSLMWQSRRAHRSLTMLATLALVIAHLFVLGALAMSASRGELSTAALVVYVQAVITSCALGLVGEPQWWLGQALAISSRVAALRRRPVAARVPGRPSDGFLPRPGPVAVRLEHVHFRYPRETRSTLRDLSLEIPAGQSLAIVGENGAGKSTLIKLLCGLYEPDAGTITLDGKAPLEARGRIGIIFQDFVRYKLPLRENVAFGYLPLLQDTNALEQALRAAGGGTLLPNLPAGWDTVLSREFTGGIDLSGGEWQRVALARALVAVRGGAGLLILDEPTASLDVRAEIELFEHFLRLTRGITTVLVSHRLSSVRRADRIIVLGQGGVLEDGTHDELVSGDGVYAAMFATQASHYDTTGGAWEHEAAHA